jgi:large subunit ribosomal protein L30
MANERKVLVKQIRSQNGRTKPVQDTLRALGLGRIGREKEHTLSPCVYGMLRKVNHLVRVTDLKS